MCPSKLLTHSVVQIHNASDNAHSSQQQTTVNHILSQLLLALSIQTENIQLMAAAADISNQVISQQDCAVCMSDFSRANFKCSANSLSLLSYSFSFITFLGSFGSTLLFYYHC